MLVGDTYVRWSIRLATKNSYIHEDYVTIEDGDLYVTGRTCLHRQYGMIAIFYCYVILVYITILGSWTNRPCFYHLTYVSPTICCDDYLSIYHGMASKNLEYRVVLLHSRRRDVESGYKQPSLNVSDKSA